MPIIIQHKQKKQITIYQQPLGNDINIELVKIPAGSFIMGAPATEEGSRDAERPQHLVTVKSFMMGRYPITQEQWKAIAIRKELKVNVDLEARIDPSNFKEDYQGISRWKRPVEQISWTEAVEFCARLSKLTTRNYRLPTEAQWEYACRSKNYEVGNMKEEEAIKEWNRKYHQPFHFGETITSDLANYNGRNTFAEEEKGEYRRETTPVGLFSPNGFGLYDMHGNVWEWCEDDYEDNYENTPRDGTAHRKESMKYIVLRGGSWFFNPLNCRSADRLYTSRGNRFNAFGFRIAYVAEEAS